MKELNKDSSLDNSNIEKQNILTQKINTPSKTLQLNEVKSNSSVFKYKKLIRFEKSSLDFQADLIQFKDFKGIERIAANFFHTSATSYKNLIQTKIKDWSKPSNRGSGEFLSSDYYFHYTSEITLETNGIILFYHLYEITSYSSLSNGVQVIIPFDAI